MSDVICPNTGCTLVNNCPGKKPHVQDDKCCGDPRYGCPPCIPWPPVYAEYSNLLVKEAISNAIKMTNNRWDKRLRQLITYRRGCQLSADDLILLKAEMDKGV
jgi:hypothetical protein